MHKQVIFLDADGVLWPDLGAGSILTSYNLGRVALQEFAASLSERNSYLLSIVTNQTLAARGSIAYEIFSSKVSDYFNKLIEEGLIDNFEVCFHHPKADYLELRKICECRKPSPGMLLSTLTKFNLSSFQAFFIGDRITDMIAADAAGITHKILILSNKSMEMNDSGGVVRKFPPIIDFSLVDNLNEAASLINRIRDND